MPAIDKKDIKAGDFVLCESMIVDCLVGRVYEVHQRQRTKLILVNPGEDQTGRKPGVGDKTCFLKTVVFAFTTRDEAEAFWSYARSVQDDMRAEVKKVVMAAHALINERASTRS